MIKVTIYTTAFDIHKIVDGVYDNVRWSVWNNEQLLPGTANIEIHVNYETYIRLQDAASDQKQLIQG
mgnify:CR=1 FL=1